MKIDNSPNRNSQVRGVKDSNWGMVHSENTVLADGRRHMFCEELRLYARCEQAEPYKPQ
jgi:hypothetical protein